DVDADHTREQRRHEVDEVRIEPERVHREVAVDAAPQRVDERHHVADVVDVEPVAVADRRKRRVHAASTSSMRLRPDCPPTRNERRFTIRAAGISAGLGPRSLTDVGNLTGPPDLRLAVTPPPRGWSESGSR